jgi:CDP-diacylglycerol pyrophosphatase
MQALMTVLSARRPPIRIACAAFALAAWSACASFASAADPDILWKIVHEQCVPDEQQHHNAAPCAEVDLDGGVDRGHVVLKDIKGWTQYLVIPTARVTGIESAALLAPGAPNYWAPAWAARFYVFGRAHKELPRDAIGLAVNSTKGRSQNQLHIHVECVRPDVRAYLKRHAARLRRTWTDLGPVLEGHRYLARRLNGRDLDRANPFDLLARGVPATRDHMGDWTLVAIGARPSGFVLLAGHLDAATNDDASGEELLDHDCALAGQIAGR